MTARPGRHVKVDERVLRLQAELRAERSRREAAEKNAARFHALLLQARINRIPTREER